MICHLATYPRCGAGVLKNLVVSNWRYLFSNAYEPEPFSKKWDIRETGKPGIVSYAAPEGRRLAVESPSLHRLTPDFRRRLAADDELFFVKTHELPPGTAFSGECAIQLVRHPAAAILSQWSLHRAAHDDGPPLAHYIEGSDPPGRWSDYHEAWLDAPMPVMRMRYEDVWHAPRTLVEAIAAFLGLPVPVEPLIETPDQARARNPLRNPCIGPDGWKDAVTVAQLQHIELRHKQAARKFGYYAFGVYDPFRSLVAPVRGPAAGVAPAQIDDVVQIHIPRTAGSSVYADLYEPLRRAGVKFHGGHCFWGDHPAAANRIFFVVLREPMARERSRISHIRNTPEHAERDGLSDDIDAFLRDPARRSDNFNNGQLRQLAGRETLGRPTTMHDLFRAIRVLNRPDVIACTVETIDQGLARLSARLGLPIPPLSVRVNAAPPITLSEEAERILWELNPLDRLLYRYVARRVGAGRAGTPVPAVAAE